MASDTFDVLRALVGRVRCKPGWTLCLKDEDGALRLVIQVPGYDSAGAASTDKILRAAERVERATGTRTAAVNQELLNALEELHGAWGAHRRFIVNHYRPVPTATYNERTWRRWIFEQCRMVENHELGEWFRDGAERPFAPRHGPGEDPYTVCEYRPEADALTTQDGSLRKPYG